MELKQRIYIQSCVAGRLLIVPYGIETIEKHERLHLGSRLLIVPYGIETRLR